ncbi:MAG: DUF424 family protein [Candidatus Altiarchaeota archaeon]
MKVHKVSNEIILAACDVELIGKKISEGELEIEIKKEFYGGELRDIEDLKNEIEEATIVNLIGNKVVDFAIKNNFVDKKNVLKIADVKHAQIIVL